MRRAVRALCLVVLALGWSSFATANTDEPRVRLVVVVVLDQFPEWILERTAAILPEDSGLSRLLREGVWYQNAWYPQATTVTAIGHSVLATGAPPRLSGIYGNSWYDPAAKRTVYCVADPEFALAGAKGAGVSPRRLKVPAVGDLLASLTAGRAKVLSFSGKDRSAVLTAGYAGKAYWYSAATGGFVSSTYYHPSGELPAWLERTNEKLNALAYRSAVWNLLLPAGRYPAAADERPGEPAAPRGVFPHQMPSGEGVRSAVRATPFLNELTLRVAREAVEAEQLGADETPDLLWLCLSATDSVGHAYGPLSLEYQDCLLRTGQALGEFFRYLDERLGADGWAAALSADHGVAPCPEGPAAVGLPAERVSLTALLKTVEAEFYDGLSKAGTEEERRPSLLRHIIGPFLFLNPAALRTTGLSEAEARRRLVQILRRQPQVLVAYDAVALQQGSFPASDRYAEALYWSLAPEWDADVAVVLRPLSIPGSPGRATGTTHGSPHSYDANVPVVVRLPGLRPGVVRDRTSVAQLAATIARWLALPPPAPADALPGSGP